MVVMAERVQEQGLSAGMSEFSREHGDEVGGPSVTKTKPDAVKQFRGVRRKPTGRYTAQIWVPSLRGNVSLGTFDTSEEAIKAYDAAAVELHLHACTPAKAAKKKKADVELHACTPGWAVKKKRATARLDAWTKFRGVYRLLSGRYGAQIKQSRARTWLGTFDAAEDAARAYDDAAVKLHGARAVTNFKQPRKDKDTAAETMTAKKKAAAARQDAQTKYGEEGARAHDAAAVRPLGATAKTNFEQPPTGATADDGEESPMDLVNDFLEMPALGFLSQSFASGAQLDDLWADLAPAERQLGDEFIMDTDFSAMKED